MVHRPVLVLNENDSHLAVTGTLPRIANNGYNERE
nr:MAG TPA: hypothetical protein [Caudoviricetes sp.]DAS36098.1 MAG TPA: hypothetical protein [Caudoviricetes sp.]DAT29759.1 MAG TPA: hypothetical protein [Caudoviricetes sp.]